ncbi:patatin-like phospholipase family protein [Phyllobacterium sp. 22552]|uniref:patatin-like phospholipase family protein n=1 Tax=Phyllobacterium sp. 22552 TaxID=3453941 RepID=UPI003F8347D6
MADGTFKVLSLDGGGAKGFYTLGVLRQLEGMLGGRLAHHFDLIYGTSTGSIIGALLGLGHSVESIKELYEEHVVKIVGKKLPCQKSAALMELASSVFGKQKFDAFQTEVGIVTTKWLTERPMIFKTSAFQAFGGKEMFEPGFGCSIAEAVEASCSAYPFFKRKIVRTNDGELELIDGGYCANNPTLYAVADAREALGIAKDRIRILSVGVGEYPPVRRPLNVMWWLSRLPSVKLLQKTLEINTQSMDQLRTVLFREVKTVRISDSFSQPEMATDLFENDIRKLNILRQRGKDSFAKKEIEIRELLGLQAE